MAKTDTLNIRINPDVKKKAETTLDDLGLTMAEAVNIFFKQIIMTESIPFVIKKPRLNAETIEAMRDVEVGKNISKGYTDLDEMWADIDKHELVLTAFRTGTHSDLLDV